VHTIVNYSRVPNIHTCALIDFGKKVPPVRLYWEPVHLKKFHEPVRLKKFHNFFWNIFLYIYQKKLYINVNLFCPFLCWFFKSDCYLGWTCNCYTLCAYLDLCVYLFFEKCRPSAIIMPMHSDKKSKNQTGNSAAMFIKPKNHKIDLILPWRCFLEFLAFYFFLNVKRMFCYEVEFENRALETQENSTMVKLNQFWRYFV